MRRIISISAVLVGVLALLPTLASAHTAPSGSPPIRVIKVEGAIDGPLLGFLNEQLDAAVTEDAVVVLELDTAGTIDEDAVALADRVANMPVPVLTWVGPVPARASGAGLLLMYASSLAGVAPGSQTGPLEPIDLLHPEDVPPDLDQKIDGWLAARGRTVDRSLEDQALTAQQAVDGGFADPDATASLVTEFLNEVDGAVVQTPSGPVTLHTKIATTDEEIQQGGGVSLSFVEPGPVRRVQHGVASPSMIYFLLILGLACIAFELTQPGFGFAGFAGLFLLALAGYGVLIVPPTSWLGFGLLLVGVGLMEADVLSRRLGALTAAGLIVFVGGSLLVYSGVGDAIRISPWLIGGATVASFLYYGFGLTVAIQSRDRILSTQRGLIGLTGEARGKLAPDGPVYVKGALWRGRALTEDPIAPGTRVRVRGVDGLILKVEAAPADATDEPVDDDV